MKFQQRDREGEGDILLDGGHRAEFYGGVGGLNRGVDRMETLTRWMALAGWVAGPQWTQPTAPGRATGGTRQR